MEATANIFFGGDALKSKSRDTETKPELSCDCALKAFCFAKQDCGEKTDSGLNHRNPFLKGAK